jgi:hypothetical protein
MEWIDSIHIERPLSLIIPMYNTVIRRIVSGL